MAISLGIVGNYGHHNVGDEAILWALISQVRTRWPNSEIVIFSDDVGDTQDRFPDCTCLPVIPPGPSKTIRAAKTVAHVWRTVRSLDLLVIGGGGLFVDSYRRVPRKYAGLIALARLAGTRVVCYQIGAGPITTFAGRQLFRLAAHMVNAISVRDAESERALRRIGVRRDILVQADPALLLEPIATDNLPLRRDTEGRLRVGVAPVPYFAQGLWYGADADKFDRYVAELAQFADNLLDRYHAVPVFLRFSRGDDVTARAIQGRMRRAREAVVLPQEYDPRQLLTIVGQMDFFVGTRLHALIFATAMKVPCVAIAYQEKVHNYMQAVGQGDRVLDVDSFSAQRLMEQFDALYRDQVQVRGQLEHSVRLLQDQARQGAALLADVLAERIR